MDLDPDKVTNNMDEASLQAELMKQFQAPLDNQQQQQPPAGTDPMDPTGAGGATIGTGVAPTPGEQGFTGSPQDGQQQQQQQQSHENTHQPQAAGQTTQAHDQLK